MARISIVTITYTILLAILFLISKGWNTTAFSLTRNQATYLTMIMGAVYLTYSAYFLSADFIGISYFMKGLMAVLYLGLGLVNLKNLRETINMIKGYQTQSMRDNPNDIMLPALKLKETILKRFTVMMLGYFILKIIKYGLISFLGDETLSERFSLAVQCFDLVFLGASLFIFRSRFWPSFYRLGLNELAVPFLNNLDGGNRNMYLAPMLETSITQKLLSDKYINENTDRCDSIGSDEVVVILNPTKYTINDDEDMDKMDAEDIVSSLNDKLYSQFKLIKISNLVEIIALFNQFLLAEARFILMTGRISPQNQTIQCINQNLLIKKSLEGQEQIIDKRVQVPEEGSLAKIGNNNHREDLAIFKKQYQTFKQIKKQYLKQTIKLLITQQKLPLNIFKQVDISNQNKQKIDLLVKLQKIVKFVIILIFQLFIIPQQQRHY